VMSDSQSERDEHSAAPSATAADASGVQGVDQQSVTDVLQEPAVKQYVRTVAGAMAFVGAGIGVMVVLLGAFGSAPNTAGLSGQMSSQQYKLGLVNTAIGVAPYVALAVAGGAGILVGLHFEATTRKAVIATAAGVLVGTVFLVFVTDVLAVSQAPSIEGQSAISLDYAQVLVNSVLMGVGAAVAGGGSAYFGDAVA